MELRQLEYFVTVVEEGGFTRAAAKLHVAQPGVSAQIRQLERELGHDLLDRTGRKVRLTEVGAAVLPYARAALAAVAGARLTVEEMTGLLRGRVTVGMVAAISALDLPGLLADFHRDHPAVEITLAEADAEGLLEALQDGRVDLALISLWSAPQPGIATQVVIDQPIVAAVAPDDELAGRSSIPLADLRGRALIALPRGAGLRHLVEEACAAAGFRPHIAFEASEPYVLAELAGRGLGVALLPESAVRRAELHMIAITPRLRGRIALAWRSEGPVSPAARALIDRARRHLPNLTAPPARIGPAHPAATA
jgi:DNA-binding transcriptional LysR family regulator